MPTLKEILRGTSDVRTKYIPDWSDLEGHVKLLRQAGYTISMTQGVYDMFHVGHGRYLEAAKGCGDILIVGVDSDELTRSMKGPDRPFDNFEERIEVLAMLGFVDIITKRDVGEDKYDLIKLVRPDVLVMSQSTRSFGDEDIRALEGFCGEIKHLEAKAATSTTAKLRRLKIEGNKELFGVIDSKVKQFSADLIVIMQESMKGEE